MECDIINMLYRKFYYEYDRKQPIRTSLMVISYWSLRKEQIWNYEYE